MTLAEILESVATGQLSVAEAERYLSGYGFIEVGYQKLDPHRARRTAVPEVIYGASKSVEQLGDLVRAARTHAQPILITRVDERKAGQLLEAFPELSYDPTSRLVREGIARDAISGDVTVVSAGASDFPVAEEAAQSLEFFGTTCTRVYDCGVAGLHRLFASGEKLAAADLLIVVAGMDGALPSVIAGMFSQPVIAVPTSVGYGAAFEGLSALLTMLNTCAPGVTVVNIDNGFGAAVAARAMLKMKHRAAVPVAITNETSR